MKRDAMEYLVQGNVRLPRGRMLSVADGAGMLVYVWSGAVWITQEGDVRDRHVPAGGWFRIERQGLTLIQALGRTELSLTAPQPEGYSERIGMVAAAA